MAAAGAGNEKYSYPESEANGWTGTCVDGMNQSPIDLDSSMKAEVHAPINFRNYFNGHFNKVHFVRYSKSSPSIPIFYLITFVIT